MPRRLKKRDRRAIEVIEGFIPEIKEINNTDQGYDWSLKVYSHVLNYIGENVLSGQIKRINFNYVQKTLIPAQAGVREYMKTDYVFNGNNEKDAVEKLLRDVIHYIRAHGVLEYQDAPKENFLYRIGDLWLGIFIPLILGGIGTVGYLVGSNVNDKEEIKINQDYKRLRDSLAAATLEVANNISNSTTEPNGTEKVKGNSVAIVNPVKNDSSKNQPHPH